MALQALRTKIGEDTFWALLRTWLSSRAGTNGSVPDFRALAESVSGQELDGFFDIWLSVSGRPAKTEANGF